MTMVRLADLRMTIESKSYIDAMHAIITHRGWMNYSKPMLSGVTVSGFRFTVQRRLTIDSCSAYNWIAENFLAADFVGLTSSQQAGFTFDATFPLYRKHAISVIKQAIDRGTGAVFWKDDFVVATGYDDEQQVLYYSNGLKNECETLRYEDFGRNLAPYWYYQVIEDQVGLDEAEIFKESLIQAVYKWETHDPILSESEYACGKKAYCAILHAIQNGDYDRQGAKHVFACYAAAKRDIATYSETLQRLWPESAGIADHYAKLSQLFGQIEQSFEAGQAKELIALIQEAGETEEQAIQSIKDLLRETMDNRFDDIGLR